MSKNYYEILGVKRDANSREIKKAFYKLALEAHPDKVADQTNEVDKAAAEEKMQKFSAIFDTLRDGEKRKIYDASLPDTKSDKPSHHNANANNHHHDYTYTYTPPKQQTYTPPKENVADKVKEILNKHGIYKADLAEKFTKHEQVDALEEILKHKQPAEDALKFTASTNPQESYYTYNGKSGYQHGYQFNALKLGATAEQAMKIDSQNKLYALQKLGIEKADIAAQIANNKQLEAVKIIVDNKLDIPA